MPWNPDIICETDHLEEMLDNSASRVAGLVSASTSSPSQAVHRREVGVVLVDALASLSEEHREVVVLRSLQQLDWPEVAKRMGRTVSAVQKLWARALKQLRPCIEAKL